MFVKRGIYVAGLREEIVTCAEQVLDLMEFGECNDSFDSWIHVPYRDSKLTRILQPALGGNANTAIICNITLAQVIYYFATLVFKTAPVLAL
ncbi:hypothetical protein BHE74_00021308 [Ensete ventricosum]|nr:hypothetical protein BHE74_00021308 [Ensete ventricosum]